MLQFHLWLFLGWISEVQWVQFYLISILGRLVWAVERLSELAHGPWWSRVQYLHVHSSIFIIDIISAGILIKQLGDCDTDIMTCVYIHASCTWVSLYICNSGRCLSQAAFWYSDHTWSLSMMVHNPPHNGQTLLYSDFYVPMPKYTLRLMHVRYINMYALMPAVYNIIVNW